MIQLSALMWVMAAFFAVIGFLRGWSKEVISMSGIILGLFALFQFDSFIRGVLLVGVDADQVFFVQAVVFAIVVFFAYQTRAIIGDSDGDGRDSLQESVLGALLGFVNGYLIWGSLWYFLDINSYPLDPYVTAPAPGSPSEQALNILPLVILGGGPQGSGDLLSIVVIVLFLIVLIVI